MTKQPTANEPTEADTAPEPTLHEQELARRANADAIRELGAHPYGSREDGITALADAKAMYDEAADQDHQANSKTEDFEDKRPVAKVAGRIILKRDTGKLVWLNLRDHTGDMQIAVSKRDAEAPGFDIAKAADLSDIVVAEGPIMRTRTGEVTVWASAFRPGSKSLTPPPAKQGSTGGGLTDTELRYRRRYVDLWANPDAARVFKLRSAVVATIRDALRDRGYVEVETPMLQAQAGGAAATPFKTHLRALGMDLYLRIAPELYLKRLLVGGLPRVFEVNRNFRNEGVDKSHNPEFTMLELYHAFGNYHVVMEVTEYVIRAAARTACEMRTTEDGIDADTLTIPFDGNPVHYAEAFDRVTYAELFERALGFATTDTDKVMAAAKQHNIKTTNDAGEPLDPLLVVNELFEDVAEKSLDPAKPTWIMDYPAALSPLTRPKLDDSTIAERADLFIGGMEIGPHYTELNDPDVQEAKFREQLAGIDSEEQTFRTFDDDFIRALKVGMPPAGGMGLGIDRLVMLLADQRSIRDVLLFPFMRPEQG